MSTHTQNETIQKLKKNPMMRHLVEALQEGTDIGHYGRLVFAMVARHFMSPEELAELLSRAPTSTCMRPRAL